MFAISMQGNGHCMLYFLSFFQSLTNEFELVISLSIVCGSGLNPKSLAIFAIYSIVLTNSNDWMRDVIDIKHSLGQTPAF